MAIEMYRMKHFADRLDKHNQKLLGENRAMQRKLELMKQIMVSFDH